MRNRILIAAKLALSAGVFYVIGSRFDINQLMSSLKNANSFYLLLATTVAVLAVPAVGGRWHLLAKMFSFPISTATATRATFAGLFVGQVLPGGVGADVIRGWMVWNTGIRNASIVTSLIADRLISLLAIAFMIVLSLPILMPLLPKQVSELIKWCMAISALLLPIIYLTLRKLQLPQFTKFINWTKYKLNIESKNLSIQTLFYALGWAVLGHALMILSAYFLSLAIGVSTSFWMWLLIMPTIILVTVLPISINGWGVREFAMIYLWGLFGIAEADAFLISLCVGIVAIVSSLPGFWFWLRKNRDELSAEHAENEITPQITSLKKTP